MNPVPYVLPQKDFRKHEYDDKSGFTIGDTDTHVSVYQLMIGTEMTGVWSEVDEKAYEVWAEAANWKLIWEVLDAPSFWDIGVLDPDMILNMDFDD